MPYTKQDWVNEPNTTTPISADRLKYMETQYEQSLADGKAYTRQQIAAIKLDPAAVGAMPAQIPYLENVSLYSYGHSYTMYPGPYSTPYGGEYQMRVASRLGLGTVYSRGRSGTPAPDNLGRMLAPALGVMNGINPRWVPGSRGIVLIENYMNEAATTYGADPKYLDMWLRTIRSMAALISSNTHLLPASGTKVGTWTKSAGPGAPLFAGDDCVFTQSTTATISYTVPGDEIWVVAAASSTYSLGGFKVVCNGKTVGTFETNGTNISYSSTVLTNGFDGAYWPCIYKVTGLNAAAGTTGSKTVTISATSATTMFHNGVLIPNPNPPQIFLAKEPTRNPNATDAAASARFASIRSQYEARVDQIASEFPNVTAVDLEPGWDNTKFVGSLDVVHKFHPNDLGMQHIATKFVDAIKDKIKTTMDGVMVL